MANTQFDESGQLRHFLSIEGLTSILLRNLITQAGSFLQTNDKPIIKTDILKNKTIANLFFEPSTRTRSSFELAASRLGADVFNLDIKTSAAATKGESLLDTVANIAAMGVDLFVIRHSSSGAAEFVAQHLGNTIQVINAGDGWHAHPTQALLDLTTILHYKNDMSKLKVAIVGDIYHSRVARSQIHGLNLLGVSELNVIGPKTLLPQDIENLGVKVFHNMDEGIKDVDVIIMLRLQKERMKSALFPSESEYYKSYGLTEKRLDLAAKDAIVMHPGPMNRGVEIASDVADGKQSVILQQVNFGVAVRMAVITSLLTGIKG